MLSFCRVGSRRCLEMEWRLDGVVEVVTWMFYCMVSDSISVARVVYTHLTTEY